MYNEKFWNALDTLLTSSEIIIDRSKGSKHPRFSQIIYPLDYGYLEGTTSGDGDDIDIWLGSNKDREIDAIMCTIDLMKRDSEIKILIGCTEDEKETVHKFHNHLELISGVLIRRDEQ